MAEVEATGQSSQQDLWHDDGWAEDWWEQHWAQQQDWWGQPWGEESVHEQSGAAASAGAALTLTPNAAYASLSAGEQSTRKDGAWHPCVVELTPEMCGWEWARAVGTPWSVWCLHITEARSLGTT